VFITRPEIEGLMANLLYVTSPPAGKTKLTDWVVPAFRDGGKNITPASWHAGKIGT